MKDPLFGRIIIIYKHLERDRWLKLKRTKSEGYFTGDPCKPILTNDIVISNTMPRGKNEKATS